ncbi:amino acid permease [Amycolatopsis rubida]|uniref:Amino acid permease n=2 Tax=Pseudonocardiaceae TaxID=2070 RepID=A0A1I6B8G3_9PSEU|nr:amino acid permease [Amycolatopsis rubida]NEC58038.1 amino acid permease [Amycolatopsis rubida]OAP20965.1 GABA permease [Amycolatopsis sp. M39]SFQ77246.1 gamma-aminobutyrate:proton symporter, AAT family [Amycolatopsis rubida]
MGSAPETAAESGLKPGLKQRHMNLIALGGVIGAGLFVGSGVVIQSAGPAAVVSFFIAGLITVLIMRMLAEMTVARPALGSFYVYAREAMGNRAGFTVGWMYWYFFVIVVAVEAVAGGRILQLWLPNVPLWVLSLGLLLLLTATNLVSARSYGEFEYWFSSIKVIAILVFLVVGALYLFGVWPGAHGGLGNLVSHGGFAPMGIGAVLAAVVPCVGFYTGAEIVTIAAAESAEPRRAIAKAMRSIVFRVVLFYVGSVFVVVAVKAWNAPDTAVSPYAAVLDVLGIPAVATIMNAIVLTAVLSCLNSALYTSSRMLFALTRNGDAPKMFTKLSRSGVPRRAIIAGTVIGYVSVIAAYTSPNLIFQFLVNSYGAVALFVYLAIALAQVRLRKRLQNTDPGALSLKMWLFPWLSYATIALMAAVILAMAFLPTTRSQFWLSAVTLALILIAYQFRKRRPAGPAAATETDSSRGEAGVAST